MDATTEGEVGVGGPVPVELLGVVEHIGIVVGGAGAEYDDGAGLDRPPVDGATLGGDAHGHLHGAVVAEELVDGGGVEGGVGPELGQRIGLGEEADQAVAEEVGGGLVAGDE